MPRSTGSGTTSGVDEEYVADSGLYVRWYIPQAGYEHARDIRDRVTAQQVRLHACDSVRYEVAHVLRTQGLLKGRLTREEYVAAAIAVESSSEVEPVDARAMFTAAGLAADRSLRVFDAVLVELAQRLGLPLLTSDKKLLRAVGDMLEVELLRGITR